MIEPTIPVEVETRKNVFISQTRAGLRKTVIKSGAVRFYSLNFRFRDQDEYLDQLAEVETNYPATPIAWTNADLGASGNFFIDSELKSVVDNPDTFSYSLEVRSENALSPTDPGTLIFPYKPNFAYDITNTRKTLVSDSIAFARVAKSTSNTARQFQYTFKNRTLAELLIAENFWAYYYPQTQITFEDDTFDEDLTFFFDSNFKWTVNGINLIDYTFVFTEVLEAPDGPVASVPTAPSSLVATASSDTEIGLTWTDNSSSETGFKIERCDGAACSDFAQIATVPHNYESYLDTELTPDTLYRYRVRAYNGAGNSTYSNIDEDTTEAAPEVDINDNFNRANSTSGLGTATSGETWTANVGVFQIDTNQAKAFTLSGGQAISTIESAVADVEVEVKIVAEAGDSTKGGIVFRLSDSSNYFRYTARGSGDGTVRLERVQAGSAVDLFVSVPGPSTPFTIKAEAVGDQIRVYRAGVLIATIIDEDFNEAATKHGVYVSGAAPILDDFSIVSV